MSCRDFPCSAGLCPHSSTWGRESDCIAQILVEGTQQTRLGSLLTGDRPRIWTQNFQSLPRTDSLLLCPHCTLIRLRMWIFHFNCGIYIWLREDQLPPPCLLAFAHGGQLWLPPGVEMEQSQDRTSKPSREVCTASSWLWSQLRAFWAEWN